LWWKRFGKRFDWPTRREDNTSSSGCSGAWIGMRETCFCGFVGLRVGEFPVWRTTLLQAKQSKHEKTRSDNQHVFILFAFDIFGFLEPNVVDFLKRVQRVANNNIMSHRSINIVFWRISFAIQKNLAAQFVVRLAFVHA
jgi:hypothetical protein